MMKQLAPIAFVFIFAIGFFLDQDDANDIEPLIIVDTHIDVPYRLTKDYEDIGRSTQRGDFDYVRARAGGLTAAFMSIYVPVERQLPGFARDYADHLIDLVELARERNKDKFAIAKSTEEVDRISRSNRVALALGIENGAAIENDIGNLHYFYNRGVRYITLAHAEANQIADSSYDDDRPWGGLSPFGVAVVGEMNRLGIVIDVSHITDEAVLDVLAATSVPVLASHSSARAFTPGFERNLSDELIRKIAAGGGVVQVNFGSAFLTEAANRWYLKYFEQAEAYREANGLGIYDPLPEFEHRYRAANPLPFATLENVLDHIDHIVALTGVEHVGFGSDFDGVGDSLPHGLKSVADYPALLDGLRNRGYSEDDIRQIAGRNTLRVWHDAERFAETRRLVRLHGGTERFGGPLR